MIGIYLVRNLINGKRYIGQSRNIERRFIEHKMAKYERNPGLREDLAQFGPKNFSYEVLEECSPEQLCEREIYYIASLKPEYNLTIGGAGPNGMKPRESTKALLRDRAKDQWARMTEEERKRMLSNLTGPKKGHPVSPETREKLRRANLGKKQSPETIRKRVESIRRNPNRNNGEKHKKPVICLETGEVFDSLKAASEKYHLHDLCSHLKGRQKSCKGLHFQYQSVETNRDECSGVGQETSCCPKCAAHESVKR